jgi:hypothetical protein
MGMTNKDLPNFKHISPTPQQHSAINADHFKRMEAVKAAAGMSGYTRETFQISSAGLYSHLEYRAKVAMQLLESGNEGEAGRLLNELFDYCNQKIKDYLAIL